MLYLEWKIINIHICIQMEEKMELFFLQTVSKVRNISETFNLKYSFLNKKNKLIETLSSKFFLFLSKLIKIINDCIIKKFLKCYLHNFLLNLLRMSSPFIDQKRKGQARIISMQLLTKKSF